MPASSKRNTSDTSFPRGAPPDCAGEINFCINALEGYLEPFPEAVPVLIPRTNRSPTEGWAVGTSYFGDIIATIRYTSKVPEGREVNFISREALCTLNPDRTFPFSKEQKIQKQRKNSKLRIIVLLTLGSITTIIAEGTTGIGAQLLLEKTGIVAPTLRTAVHGVNPEFSDGISLLECRDRGILFYSNGIKSGGEFRELDDAIRTITVYRQRDHNPPYAEEIVVRVHNKNGGIHFFYSE